jgi:hypothetical protein
LSNMVWLLTTHYGSLLVINLFGITIVEPTSELLVFSVRLALHVRKCKRLE